MKANPRSQHGGALVAAILVTGIIALYAASAFLSLHSTVRLAHSSKFGPLVKFQRELKILNEARINSFIECRNLADSPRWNESLPSLCFAHGVGRRVPLIDFNWVFSKVTSCPGRLDLPADSCAIDGAISNDVVVIENLTATNLRLESTTVRMLASAGDLSLTEAFVQSDTVLIAGRNLKVGSIASIDQQPHKVTLVAAKGSIEIQSVSPDVFILPLTYNDYRGPEFVAVPPYPLPPLVTSVVLGKRE